MCHALTGCLLFQFRAATRSAVGCCWSADWGGKGSSKYSVVAAAAAGWPRAAFVKVVLTKPGGSGAGCVGHCARYQGQVQLQIKIKIIIIMPGTCPKKRKIHKTKGKSLLTIENLTLFTSIFHPLLLNLHIKIVFTEQGVGWEKGGFTTSPCGNRDGNHDDPHAHEGAQSPRGAHDARAPPCRWAHAPPCRRARASPQAPLPSEHDDDAQCAPCRAHGLCGARWGSEEKKRMESCMKVKLVGVAGRDTLNPPLAGRSGL